MARFLDHLDLRLHGAGRWITLAPLRYESDAAGQTITVPADFVTDLASTPRFLPISYALAGGRAPGPAVVHDWLYVHDDWEDRALADAIFHEAMGVDQPDLGFEAEPAVIRSLMWSGVRAVGWWPWQRHKQRQAELNPVWTASAWPEVQAA